MSHWIFCDAENDRDRLQNGIRLAEHAATIQASPISWSTKQWRSPSTMGTSRCLSLGFGGNTASPEGLEAWFTIRSVVLYGGTWRGMQRLNDMHGCKDLVWIIVGIILYGLAEVWLFTLHRSARQQLNTSLPKRSSSSSISTVTLIISASQPFLF